MNKIKKRRLVCFLIALMLLLASFMPNSSRVSADDENVLTAQTETEGTETGDGSENSSEDGEVSEDAEASKDADASEDTGASEDTETSEDTKTSEDIEASEDTEKSEDAEASDDTEKTEDAEASDDTEKSENTENTEVSDDTEDNKVTEDSTSIETAASSEDGEEAVDFRYQRIKLYPNEDDRKVTVTLNGMMPEGATATASDMNMRRWRRKISWLSWRSTASWHRI